MGSLLWSGGPVSLNSLPSLWKTGCGKNMKIFANFSALNSECLELMAGLQEDLLFVPPRRDIVGDRVADVLHKAGQTVAALERLSGLRYPGLGKVLDAQRQEVERYIAPQELTTAQLTRPLSEVDMRHVLDAGEKAAALGEVKNRVDAPVPDGCVLTTEAYRQFCGVPLWKQIRDAFRRADLGDGESLQAISAEITQLVMESRVPGLVEAAIQEQASALAGNGGALAVRSSAVGEGGLKTFAGQFLTLLNVPAAGAVDAYRRVIAGRFSPRALSYRISSGLSEVDSPLAVLFLPVIPARAAGVMYTRDPGDPKSKVLWITSTRGLGVDVAAGSTTADLFLVSRSRSHRVAETHVVDQRAEIILQAGGGLERRPIGVVEAARPSLTVSQLEALARWGVRIEDHFGAPQDIEWLVDEQGKIWILQARPLALVEAGKVRSKPRTREEAVLSGGRTIFPGQVSGPAHLVQESQPLRGIPEGAILFLRRASPEIVETFPRISGIVAERGNIAGHAASLLREFKIPSVFLMKGAFERIQRGDAVSLDAAQAKVYAGALWAARKASAAMPGWRGPRAADPISERLLTLNLIDPQAHDFRPGGCRSAHDVIRFCHEKAVETMFEMHDLVIEHGHQRARQLQTGLPLNLYVLDIRGGIALENPAAAKAETRGDRLQALPKPLEGDNPPRGKLEA